MISTIKQEPCDRTETITRRSENCHWITVHDEKQFRANMRIALDTEVEAGGPYLNNGWNQCEASRLEAIADAIDEARFKSPVHPRERPRPFSEADRSEREYALRLARAAIKSGAIT
jgi:hypothetical protein